VGYWCAAQLESGHINFALHCLERLGYEIYAPRLRTYRVSHGRKIQERPLLFWPYVFVGILEQWHAARWAPGVVRLVMAGDTAPARVPDGIIGALKAREKRGAIELTQRPQFRRGDRVRILQGPFSGHLAIYAGMKPHERVEVLLALLGSERQVVLPKSDVEVIEAGR
jgi:transcriptional antiterminator RfaH